MLNKDIILLLGFWVAFTAISVCAGFFGGIVYEYKSLSPEFTCDLTANIEPLEIK